MKTTILLLFIVVFVTYCNSSIIRVRRQLPIPKEFKNINIEDYIKNERAVAFQLKCIVYDGPCDRIGKYLKITIPQILSNQCKDCQSEQKKLVGRMIGHIQEKYPKEWEDAVKKYQNGDVTPEDAKKLEELTGVKLDPKLVGSGQ